MILNTLAIMRKYDNVGAEMGKYTDDYLTRNPAVTVSLGERSVPMYVFGNESMVDGNRLYQFGIPAEAGCEYNNTDGNEYIYTLYYDSLKNIDYAHPVDSKKAVVEITEVFVCTDREKAYKYAVVYDHGDWYYMGEKETEKFCGSRTWRISADTICGNILTDSWHNSKLWHKFPDMEIDPDNMFLGMLRKYIYVEKSSEKVL